FCETQLEECFFLENDQIKRSYQLDNFNQIISHLPGEYTKKLKYMDTNVILTRCRRAYLIIKYI
ncbi:hypothetical protein N9Z01_08315, partial [Flavobacteriaceae bacterium]|nr:hypothetical protein [Flavobacteriaceae bacterium]